MTDGLREAYRHQLIALRALRRQIAREDRMFREIMAEVRAAQGTPCAGPIAEGFECRTHAFCELRSSGGICAEALDDMDEEGEQ